MSRNRMSMLRNLSKDAIKYGIEYLISQNAGKIGEALLTGSEIAKKLGVKNDVVENLLDKGIKGITNIKRIPPGVFFEERVLPVGEVLITDIVKATRNNSGNSAYPQETYAQKPTPSSEKYFYNSKENLTTNDYFKNVKKQKDDDIFRESKERMPVSLFLPSNMSKVVEKRAEEIIKKSDKQIKGRSKKKIRPDVAKARKEIREFNKANKQKKNYLYKVEL